VTRCGQNKIKQNTSVPNLRYQILSITCDNATSNDKMIDELARRLVEYPGAPNRARCFTHILNLVVKSMMHQFDVPKKRWDAKTDERTDELLDLAGDIEAEELETQREQEDSQEGPEEGPSHDNDEGWVNEREDMTEEDKEELEDSVWPIRVLLTKVSK
jgi:hypothetical protein